MKDKIWAWLIGTGFVLFAIHNPLQPWKEYAFLPIVGLTFSMLGMFVILTDHWKKITLGSKKLWIPLAVISASIAGSGFVNPVGEGATALLAPMIFGIYLFGVYLVGRIAGKELFRPFAWAVIVGAVGCLVYGIIYPGVKTGGWISPTNYDIATGLLVFGTIVSIWQKQWMLTAIAIVGLFFTGAAEALFACGVLLVVVLVRKDWSRKILLPVGALVLTLAICTPIGITQALYIPSVKMVEQAQEAVTMETITEEDVVVRDKLLEKATGLRWLTHWRIPPIKPLGYGYSITDFSPPIPHNVPLVIVHQIGVVAAIAWLWVTLLCLVRTRWKYAFIGVLALSVFDHFVWTQVAPWWWCLVGVASASSLYRDLIFKEVRYA